MCRAGLLAEALGHDRLRVDTARDRVPVLAVAREDPVIRLERRDAADDGGLLADVEVAVAADLGFGVLLLGAFLEPPDQLHLAVQGEQAVAIRLVQLNRFRVDRSGGWWSGGRGFDRGPHLLLSILHLRRLLGGTGGSRELSVCG